MRIASLAVAVLLAAAMPLTLYSSLMQTHDTDTTWQSPTRTFNGYVNAVFHGVFHHQVVQPYEDVFYLDTGEQRIRLIFYCKSEQWNYCRLTSQLNVTEGQHITVRGTAIEPSQWQSELSQPRLEFVADLYVAEVQVS
jgi:hypothetical protein